MPKDEFQGLLCADSAVSEIEDEVRPVTMARLLSLVSQMVNHGAPLEGRGRAV